MQEVGTAIIVCDGKIFIGQRPEGKPLAGLWEFPGGKRESGETITQCIKRELKEEINVDSEVGAHIMDVIHSYPELNKEFLLKVYMVKINNSSDIELKVHQSCAWVKVEEMKQYKFLPADYKIIQKLQEIAI